MEVVAPQPEVTLCVHASTLDVVPAAQQESRNRRYIKTYTNDLVLQEIDEFLARWQCAEVCPPLVLEDFSLKVRQCLGKIFRAKGAPGVKEALATVREYTEDMQRGEVLDWQDYLWSLLTGHSREAAFLPPPSSFSA